MTSATVVPCIVPRCTWSLHFKAIFITTYIYIYVVCNIYIYIYIYIHLSGTAVFSALINYVPQDPFRLIIRGSPLHLGFHLYEIRCALNLIPQILYLSMEHIHVA